jgi:transposase
VHDRDVNAARNILRRAAVAGVRCRERALDLAGSAAPSIPLAQGTDRNRKIEGMSTGLPISAPVVKMT